jgi:Mrp family chromosome partitioning ATPase
MTNTDQAFIKAYRRDAARASTPAPTSSKAFGSRLSAVRQILAAASQQPAAEPRASAPWQTSVEFVGPEYLANADLSSLMPLPAIEIEVPRVPTRMPAQDPAIGRRPLSAFINRANAEQPAAEPPQASAPFQPETTVAAFRWPSVCRAAWQRSAADYERVAELVLKQSGAERRLIGLAGLRPGDGCTTTLLCLAAAIAGRERRVILVDANFASPQLAIQLGVEPIAAWQDVLEHGLGVAEAVIRAERDRVDLLPLDGRGLDAAQLAAGLQTSITAGVLRYAYDVVLLDLGPILAPGSFATTLHLLRNMQIDGALLVADPRHSDPSELAMAANLLEEHGCEPLGIIENRAA